MNRTAIVVAAGNGSRWNNYMNIPKHMVVIEDKQPIIERTVEQIQRHGADIFVVADEEIVKGVPNEKPENKPEYSEANKLLSSMRLWNQEGRTIIFFGDAYYTESAVNTVMSHEDNGFTVFGRAFGSNFTGKEYGEIYALSFYPEDKDRMMFAMNRINQLEKRGVIEKANVWALYRAMLKLPDDLMHMHIVGNHFINIDDWTEDFDYPEDYEKFIKRKAAA